MVYSTTPTAGQSTPFANQGTVRWEDLTNRTSHFFFEQAMGQAQGSSDTLKVTRLAAQGVGADVDLVPFRQRQPAPGDTIGFSVVVQVNQLAFRDTTFVRNSGNFRRVIVGEGGAILGSRAIMYDVTAGFQTTYVSSTGSVVPLPVPVIDNGVSRPVDVSDFIANAFARVGGVAINFDGELAAIRGDSTYLVDRTLRQQGLLATTGGNSGLDFHPDNAGIQSVSGTRMAFAASTSPQIEVYDTYHFNRCMILPTRDPIIGPIKAAKDGAGNIVLVGATAFGVVIVTVTQAQLASSCPNS
jgi:hypothetical protein